TPEPQNTFLFLEETLKYIQIIDKNATIQYAYGILEENSSKNLIGNKIFDLLSSNYQKEVLGLIEEVLSSGESKSFSIKEENNGIKLQQLFHLFPLLPLNKNNSKNLLASIVIDISDIEPELVENVADTAIILDKNGNVFAFNENAKYLTGQQKREIIGLNICDIIETKSGNFTRAGIEKVVQTGKPLNFVDRQNGNTFDSYIYPIFNMNNSVEFLAVFAHDITNGKDGLKNNDINETKYIYQSENDKVITNLNNSPGDSQFFQLVDNARDAGIVTDLQGRIIYWGKSAEELYGYTKDEIINKLFKHYFLTDDKKAVLIESDEVIIKTGNFIQRGKNGNVFLGEISNTVIYTDAGKPESYFVTIKDVTRQVRIEKEFNKFNKRLKQLVENRTIQQKKLIDKFQTEIILYKKME
ncbi:MAG: PAS domain-containing protein, partial [Calditrichia bacterium]|nr:PAS domain-containing protein [Calditrichia bacterium]